MDNKQDQDMKDQEIINEYYKQALEARIGLMALEATKDVDKANEVYQKVLAQRNNK